MSLFPDMLFLNVVRDPRAQVASMNRAIIHDFDTLLNAQAWADAHRVSRSLVERHPERVLTIRYEDFLSNQEAVLKKVCTFFGIEFLPQMLDVARSTEAQQISQLSALWESNCFPPVAANADKFKKQLSMDEIEVIETLAREYMALYGYEPMTAASARIDESAVRTAQMRSQAGRQAAWCELEQNNYRDFVLRRFRADYLAKVRAGLEQAASAAVRPHEREVLPA
jgi:hypothetical protein